MTTLPEDWKIIRLREPDAQGRRFVVSRRRFRIWKCKARCHSATAALFFIERAILAEGICGK